MNPFAQLAVEDDEDDYVQPVASNKPKKTHQERKLAKQQKIQEAEKAAQRPLQSTNQAIPEKIKQNTKTRNYRAKPQKELTDGHYHDRRSGTGRDDKPRKGRAVGGLTDELNKEKAEKEGEVTEVVEQQEEQKPEQPQGITLDEYYRSKGIEISQVETVGKKEPVKKGEVNAEWIKKQKLEVLQTKEDKKAAEEKQKQGKKQKAKKETVNSVGVSANMNSEILGFNSQAPKKQAQEAREQRPREQRPRERGQGGKDFKKGNRKQQQKVVLKEEDFPAL